LKSYDALKFQGFFFKFPEKNRKIGFLDYLCTDKTVDSVHEAVDRGATGPLWSGGHCHMRELTGARPPAAPMPESSGQGAGEGKEGPTSSTTGSPWVGRRWRRIPPVAAGSATAVMVVELKSGGNERGRTTGWCEGGGVLGLLL
jgi:hypothetical protein